LLLILPILIASLIVVKLIISFEQLEEHQKIVVNKLDLKTQTISQIAIEITRQEASVLDFGFPHNTSLNSEALDKNNIEKNNLIVADVVAQKSVEIRNRDSEVAELEGVLSNLNQVLQDMSLTSAINNPFFVLLLALLIYVVALTLFFSHSVKRTTKYIQSLARGDIPKPISFLSKEFAVLITTITKLRNDLESKEHVSSFMETLAHQVKTSAAICRSNAENLLDIPDQLTDDEKHAALTAIQETGASQKDLVNRILHLSKLERSTELTDTAKVDINILVTSTIGRLDLFFKEKQITCEYSECDFNINVDRILVEEALSNLIMNAITVSENRSTIRLTVEQSNNTVISVTDTGPGINKQRSQQIYTQESSCNGLGLKIVKAIMKLHKGKFLLENRSSHHGGAKASLLFNNKP